MTRKSLRSNGVSRKRSAALMGAAFVAVPSIAGVASATTATAATTPATPAPSATDTAAAPHDISSTTSDWVIKANNWKDGQDIGNGYTFNVTTNFSIADGAKGGDVINIDLPAWQVASYSGPGSTNVAVMKGDTQIGTLVNTASGYQITLNDNINDLDNVTASATFNTYEKIDPTQWKVGDTHDIQVIVNGQVISTDTTATRSPRLHPSGPDQGQRDAKGKNNILQVVRLAQSNNKNLQESNYLDVPATVTMTPYAGTEYDCADIMANGVTVIANGGADPQTTGSDLSTSNVVTKQVKPISCAPDKVVVPVTAIKLNDGTDPVMYSVNVYNNLTADAIKNKQTEFTGATSTVAASNRTSNFTNGAFTYNWQAGSATGLNNVPAATIKAYINDANASAPTGKTSANQDSDANTAPGVDVDASTTAKVSLSYTNTGKSDWTSAEIKDSKGNVVATIPATKVGESGETTIDLPVGASGTLTENYTITAVDKNNKTATASDPINATIKEALVPPTGQDDKDVVECGQSVTVDVLANDTASKGAKWDASTLKLVDADSNGEVKVNGGTYSVKDGKIVFTADKECAVGDIPPAKYTVTDTSGQPITQTVTITEKKPAVEPKNPTATPDKDVVECGQSVTVDVLKNDDPAGSAFDPATLKLVGADSNGQLKVSGGVYTVKDGKVVFTADKTCAVGAIPPATYTVTTKDGKTVTTTVTITEKQAPPTTTTPPATTTPSTPATPSTPVVGPKVQTDVVSHHSDNGMAFGASGLAAMVLASGIAVTRKRKAGANV